MQYVERLVSLDSKDIIIEKDCIKRFDSHGILRFKFQSAFRRSEYVFQGVQLSTYQPGLKI